MAHDPSRTEKATPRRREKAREEGSVLRVSDMDATALLWSNFFLFGALWSSTFILFVQQVAYYLSRTTRAGILAPENLAPLSLDLLTILLRLLLPYLGMNFLIALGMQFAQHGFKPSAKPLVPKFERLNPANGFKKLISGRTMVETLKAVLKLAIMGAVAYAVLQERLPMLLGTMKAPLAQGIAVMQETLFVLYRNVMLAMLGLAIADYLYQRHTFEKGIFMTKQEVKDEMKDSEGDPLVKNRQKQLMMAAAMRRIMVEVPKATVVITNPTHFAVALKYDEQSAAPICLAKGVDYLALRIRERAKATGVVVVENPPLARSLYAIVQVGRPIPPGLYKAVAEVIAFVFRLRGVA